MHNIDLEKMLDEFLEQLISRLKYLLKLIRMERQAIMHSDIKGMEEVMKKKALLKGEIGLLEKNRQAILPLLASKYNLSKNNVVLLDLIKVMPQEQAEVFGLKRKKLKKLFNRISVSHKANVQLLRKSMSFQERMFMALFSHLQDKSGYESSGKIEHSGRRLFNGLA